MSLHSNRQPLFAAYAHSTQMRLIDGWEMGMTPALQGKIREKVVKQKTRKPWGGLIALFISLLLAAACGAGYMVFEMSETKLEKNDEKRNEILFLSTALQLSYIEKMASINESKPDYIQGSENEPAMIDMNGERWFLADKNGSVMDSNGNYSNTFNSKNIFVQWQNDTACFMYNEEVLMAEKYKVIVYNRSHLDGGAVTQGSFGYPFRAASTLKDKLFIQRIRCAGSMRIFIDTDWSGNKWYLVSIPPFTLGVSDVPMDFNSVWRREAKNLLGIGAPLFLALYWLGLAYWVYLDARRRMMRADAWTVAVLITNIAGFVVYLLAAHARARREAVKTCTACGGRMLRAFPRCPWCGAPQEKRCPACSAEMKDGWTVCPHCDGTLKAAEPEPQVPTETSDSVPVPFAAPPQEKAQAPEREEEPAIPLIFQDGSPFNHN